VADSVAFARELKALGCDYITASSGGTAPDQKIILGPGYQVAFAAQIRAESGLATMAVGQINEPQQAEDILQAGQADMIALGRGMTWNPRWAWHAAEVLGAGASFPPQYARSHPSMRFGDPGKAFRERLR
jgi:2,4-dienoyl-CoA reductase-like NADH-dependent reductase (Old Yellow Enzyme family)